MIMNKKIKQSISFLLVAVLIACCAVFFSCGDSNNSVVAPQKTVYKLDYNNVTLTEYHMGKISKIFDELLWKSVQPSSATIHPSSGAKDLFDLASAGFGDFTGVFGIASSIFGWCQPNYAKMGYELDKQILSDVQEIQGQLTTISKQIGTLQETVDDDFNALFSEIANQQADTYKSDVDNAISAVSGLSGSINSCKSDSDPKKCLEKFMPNQDLQTMIVNLSGAYVPTNAIINMPTNSSTAATNYNTILSNSENTTVYTDLNSLYGAFQTEVETNSAEMAPDLDSYNGLIWGNYIRSINALEQLYIDLLYVNKVFKGKWNNNIPTVEGYSDATEFFNVSNFVSYGMMSLTSLIWNNTVSDVNIADITCENYIKTDLSYPFQAPKYWPGFVPAGTWMNTCDIYRWNGFVENYSGTWDSNTLTVQCAPITMMPNGDPPCAMFDSDPVDMNIAYSTLCNPGSGVNAQYLPPLTGFVNYDNTNNTPEPIAYGYCTSVNVGYWDNINNPITSSAESSVTLQTKCDSSSCPDCSFYIDLNPWDYYSLWANNFPGGGGCVVTDGSQIGISADYHTICGDLGGNCGPYTWILGINQNNLSDYAASGAFAFQGNLYANYTGYPKDNYATVTLALACITGDELCHFDTDMPEVLCYGLDEIQVANTGNGWEGSLTVTPNGCWQYADQTNMIPSTQ
jgi:hypothetical protein